MFFLKKCRRHQKKGTAQGGGCPLHVVWSRRQGAPWPVDEELPPIGMAVLYWLNPDRCGWGGGGLPPRGKGAQPGVPAASPGGGCHSDQRVGATPLSWGTGPSLHRSVFGGETGQQAGVLAWRRATPVGSSEPCSLDLRCLCSSCRRSRPSLGPSLHLTTPCEVGCPVPILTAAPKAGGSVSGAPAGAGPWGGSCCL